VSPHPWSLVAPWYRWQREPGIARRDTRPALHKYETSKLVELFCENPQHSLRFTSEDADPDDGRRKLYLAQHKRFYLVVCELHCDRPGFPNAARDEVCETGFVLRRRHVRVPAELEQDTQRHLQRMRKREAQISMLQRSRRKTRSGPIAVAHANQAIKREARARQRLDELQSDFDEFAITHKLRAQLEGWAPSELEGLGTWSAIEDDVPEDGDEQVFALYPLIPDPKLRPHAARGRTIFYGLVPTAASDTLPDGSPRLDDTTGYEIHCFVRRHDPHCPRKPGRTDCCGELTWSAPTETFTLASPQDLYGTSNRPVTVQLPDIPKLLDQARTLPFGAGAPLRMATPLGSDLPIAVADGKPEKGKSSASAQICSFAIPLITIVAYFVLRLFLPIVVLLFGLWFLLKLKFCILPSIKLSTEVTARLQATAPGVKLKAGGDAEAVTGEVKTGLTDHPLPGEGSNGHSFEEMLDDKDHKLTASELLELYACQGSNPSDAGFNYPPPLPPLAVPSPNSALAPLIWEPELPIPELEEVA
jgi:hypothetical protein